MKPIEFGGVLILPMHICWISFESMESYFEGRRDALATRN